MRHRLPLDIELDVAMRIQPDETTCGPTCLHAVYRYWGTERSLDSLIGEVRQGKRIT